MRVLVLGNSGTSGKFTGGTSWTRIACDRIAERLGESVDEHQAPFVPTGERAPDIAARALAELEPHLVIVPVESSVISTKFVWVRVQRLFGKRAGRWFRRFEQALNDRTYEKGRVRQLINMTLRRAAHLLIGAAPVTTRDESTRTYDRTFQKLAQAEDTEVLVVAYPGVRKVNRDPRQLAERTLFVETVRASAEARHFMFVDTAPAFGDMRGTGATIQSDGLHGTVEHQVILGEAVAEGYLAQTGRLHREPRRTS